MASLRNAGNAGITNLQAVVRSGDNRFVFTDSLAVYGDVPAGSTRVNTDDPFAVRVDPAMPMETPVACSLLLSGDADWADTLVFVVTVGELRTVDPTPDGPRRPALYWAYEDCDSGYAERPVFEWIDITGVGTRLAITADDQTVQLALPVEFGPFVFYGRSYDQLSVCGNGWVGPGYSTNYAYTNTGLPSGSQPTMIALAWDDLYPPTSNGVWWYHDEPNHRLIVQYDSMPYYSSRTSFDWFQLVIYDTTLAAEDGNSVFTVQYLTANGYNSCTVGANDSVSTVGIQCLFDGSYHRGNAPIAPGRAIRYTTTEPVTGVTEPGPGRSPVRRFGLAATPNLFRDRTIISWQLPGPGPATLTVFDVSGRAVRMLVSGTLPAGRHQAAWDARDADGAPVPSGTYICRLDTPRGIALARAAVVR
jgi:hypothetical protein